MYSKPNNYSTMSFMHLLSVLSYVLISISFTTGQQNPVFLCYDTGNFTTNSNYANNRNNILSSLATDVKSNNGFFTGSTGQVPNEVYALAICRGDSTLTECARCINSTSQDIMTECPNQKEALYMSSGCLVRYADRSFSGKMELDPVIIGCNASNLKSDMTQFGKIWGNLMDSLRKKASMSYSQFRFATGEADLTLFQTIYAVVQCTPDLSQIDCDSCLRQYVANYSSHCYGKQGGSFRGPSCMFRWELYPFYNAATTNNSTIAPGKSQISSSIIIAIVAPITVAAVLCLAGYCFLTRRARKKYYTAQEEFAGNDILTAEALQFDFGTIQAATNRFRTDNKLGAGGFGEVYKGVLPNGQEIAVKRLLKRSGQGAEEFKNEVVVVARLRHRNLVRLQGFCMEGEEKILVYEFVPNKSLDYFLYDIEKRQQLDWPKRYNIIGGIARGILYLHEDSPLRIIHRDLKASNVLLDEDMNPKIADFGMARIVGVDQTQGNTSKIVGTYGYMAPEYAMQGQFSVKSDVYSFGVLVLEIIIGKKNSSFYQTDSVGNLLSYAWELWRDETPMQLLDSNLTDSYSRDEVLRCIHIGLLCVQEDPATRPTMTTVVHMLNSYSVSPPLPQQPAFFIGSKTELNMHNSNKSTKSKSKSLSIDNASITELCPR